MKVLSMFCMGFIDPMFSPALIESDYSSHIPLVLTLYFDVGIGWDCML